ncbi:MAG: replisome organizer [Eubacteriales bacterium]|nr:replisome organizer [Eubacteriales bacterium]
MAQKRMFNMAIVDSDAFLDMPLSAQCLYFHLNMRADDDGFVGNPKRIMRTVNAHEDDLKLLVIKRFILTFDDGVIVIKHWRLHNCISQNRYHETQYTDEKDQLLIKENKAYSLSHGVPLDDKKIVEAQKPKAPMLLDMEPMEEDEQKRTVSRAEYPNTFEEFWAEYPRRADKGQAYKKYQARLKDGYSPEELLQAARRYRMECEKNRTEQKFIKLAKTFLGDATPFVDYVRKDEPTNRGSGGKADFGQYL